MRRWLVFLVVCLGLLPGTGSAHAVDVFAYAEGREIVGTVYFSSGAPAGDARVTIYGPDDEVLAEPEPNTAGEFRYTAERPVTHRLVATTGDGHRAEWTVPDDELAGAAFEDSADGASSSAATEARQADDAGGKVTIDRQALEALIERAVAREVGPLREELRGYANRARLSDIIGGIGGIIGIAGAALWWRARRREAG
jgi:nickel transport protein